MQNISNIKSYARTHTLPHGATNTRTNAWPHATFIITAVLISLLFFTSSPASGSDFRPHRNGLKIETAGAGMHRITGQDIIDAGVSIDAMDPARLRMFHGGSEIHIHVVATGSVISPDDAIVFYAPGIDNDYTGTDVFWLYWGGTIAGHRMPETSASPRDSGTALSRFNENLAIEENHVIWAGTPGAPEADYWFWERLTAPRVRTYSFDAPASASTNQNASLRLFFQGRAGGPASHDVAVSLNDQSIGTLSWSGNNAHDRVLSFSQSHLKSSGNTLRIHYRGPSGGVIYVNRFELDYQRHLEAADDRLKFRLSPAGPEDVAISGFSSEDISIYDITDPAKPEIIENPGVQADSPGFRALFSHPAGTKTWAAVSAAGIQAPDRITRRSHADLKNTQNSADYLIITAADLAPALENLLELRRRQGMETFVAHIEEIYDVFSFGRFDPTAIHDFLEYTWNRWQTPPQFVLLAGDANLDYRNYFGTDKENIVPSLLEGDAELGLMPSDNRFACVSGNAPLPDIYIGRIPGSTKETMADIANKLVLYESDWHRDSNRVLLVADDERGFEHLNDQLAGYLTGSFSAEKIYAGNYNVLSAATDDIIDQVNAGMLLTSFVGHGDVTRWGVRPDGGGTAMLSPESLSSLTNARRLTTFLGLNCLNGYFSQPHHHSLAEEWVMAPNSGAVAAFAPAGLSYLWEHELLGKRVFEKIFSDRQNRLGPVTTGSKIDAYYAGVSEKVLVSFNLIGDPATRLAVHRSPEDTVDVHLINATTSHGGSISPAGDVAVFPGNSQTFSIAPDSGYQIKSLTIDGEAKDPAESFTFSDVSSARSIHVVFENGGSSGGGSSGSDTCFIRTISHNF